MADENPKSEDASRDPRAEFLDAVTQWERQFDATANRMMGTEAYSQWMNQMQQGQLAMQKAVAEFMGQQLQSMNVPTRDDVIRNGEALLRIEQRLDRIERQIAKLGKAGGKSGKSGAKTGKRPARTKQPPARDPVSDQEKEA